jgi:hypothetical protein
LLACTQYSIVMYSLGMSRWIIIVLLVAKRRFLYLFPSRAISPLYTMLTKGSIQNVFLWFLKRYLWLNTRMRMNMPIGLRHFMLAIFYSFLKGYDKSLCSIKQFSWGLVLRHICTFSQNSFEYNQNKNKTVHLALGS